MRALTLLTSFLCFSLTGYSQLDGKITADRLIIRTNSNVYLSAYPPDVVGSPYLDTVFVSGVVTTANGTYEHIPMRLNAYADNVEFKQEERIMTLEPDHRLRGITIGTTRFIVGRFDFKGKAVTGFLEELHAGKAVLLAKKVVIYKEREEPTAMQYNVIPARFTRLADVYYVKFEGDDDIKKISSVKKLIEQFPNHREQLSQFAKKERISGNREDLLRLFQYYSSLN
jgi:hypothetical protein